MNTEDILNAVGKAQPELMGKTAQVIALTEKLYPEFIGDITKDFETICSVVVEKTAAVPENVQRFGLGVAGTVAGGLLGAIATDLYDAAKRGLSKGNNFRRIMEANPNLKREVDSKNLHLAYNSLHRFAPDFTADPMVGGALLKQVAELPAMSHKTIVELIGARKNLHDAKGRVFDGMSHQGSILAEESESNKMKMKGQMDTKADVRKHRLAKKLETFKSGLPRSRKGNPEPGE